jgi:hypothetical protein
LSGFAGGLDAKAYLLSKEGVKNNKEQIELPWG